MNTKEANFRQRLIDVLRPGTLIYLTYATYSHHLMIICSIKFDECLGTTYQFTSTNSNKIYISYQHYSFIDDCIEVVCYDDSN